MTNAKPIKSDRDTLYQPITLKGAILWLYPDGTLYWPQERLLLVSDLHLEKAAAQSKAGPLPVYDTPQTLADLEAALNREPVDTCVLLGDSFHNEQVASRLPQEARLFFDRIASRLSLIWILGNHDPSLPDFLPGRSAQSLSLGPLSFCHMASMHQELPAGTAELSGHYHPKARLKLRARHLSGKCFIHDDQRLILPAFGRFTGGLNMLDSASSSLFSGQKLVHFCHGTKIVSLPFDRRRLTYPQKGL